MSFLENFGWNDFFEQQQTPETRQLTLGRVIAQHRNAYTVATALGDYQADVSGKFFYENARSDDFPAVGDWVAADCTHASSVQIKHVFERKTKLSRKEAGKSEREQIIAANIDTIFVMSSLNNELNIRRIERYLAVVFESGAQPVVLLTKSDLFAESDELLSNMQRDFPHIAMHAISSLQQTGLSELSSFFVRSHTLACIGSSGVGKSTFINALLNQAVQDTGGIRETDSKGRHTTTHRELFVLPSQAMIIDTPGLRELQIWSAHNGIDETFEDIAELALLCRFKDCKHENEPECAIQDALQNQTLEAGRYQSYQKLLREERFQARKNDRNMQREEKEHWKRISKELRRGMKNKSTWR